MSVHGYFVVELVIQHHNGEGNKYIKRVHAKITLVRFSLFDRSSLDFPTYQRKSKTGKRYTFMCVILTNLINLVLICLKILCGMKDGENVDHFLVNSIDNGKGTIREKQLSCSC